MTSKKNKNQGNRLAVERNYGKIPLSMSATLMPSVNYSLTHTNGAQPLSQRQGRTLKFVDTNFTVNAATVATITDLTVVNPGAGVNQRLGDVLDYVNLILNYSISTQNIDIFSSCRCIVFQWTENNALDPPTAAQLLQLSTDFLSMYTWQASPRFRILSDFTHFLNGLPTTPNDSGHQGAIGMVVPLDRAKKSLIFDPAAVTGSGKIFFLTISDSLVAPFPLLTVRARLEYISS